MGKMIIIFPLLSKGYKLDQIYDKFINNFEKLEQKSKEINLNYLLVKQDDMVRISEDGIPTRY